MSQIALITGTSTGIGLSTAVRMAQAGFTVVATMRNLAKRTALDERAQQAGVTLDVRALDVQSTEAVNPVVREVLEKYGRIDVLVNNAGAGYLGTLEQVSWAALQETMDINFFGVWRVTQAVFPTMRAARAGRILSVTSTGGLIGQPFNDAYCAAKFAVEGMMESLAPVARRLGVHISLIEPGPVNTEFVANVQTKLPPLGDEAYRPLLEAYLAGTRQAFASVAQTGDEVAEVILKAALAEKPDFRYPTSDAMRGLFARKFTDPTGETSVALSGARLP